MQLRDSALAFVGMLGCISAGCSGQSNATAFATTLLEVAIIDGPESKSGDSMTISGSAVPIRERHQFSIVSCREGRGGASGGPILLLGIGSADQKRLAEVVSSAYGADIVVSVHGKPLNRVSVRGHFSRLPEVLIEEPGCLDPEEYESLRKLASGSVSSK